MNFRFRILVFGLFFLFSQLSIAFKDGSLGIGVSYLSYQILSKTTSKDDGKRQMLGTTFTPLFLSYDAQIGSGYFFSPNLNYSVVQPESKGGGNKESVLMLNFPLGKNFSGSQSWDWNAGLGIFQYSVIGEGGTKQLNNGTGYSTFALPSRTVSSTMISTSGGIGYNYENFKFNTDLIALGLMSNEKRTFSLMFNFLYKWDL